MPALDPTAAGHLDNEEATNPAFYAWLDILGDPIRATTAGYNVTIAGSGDAELDGFYDAIDPTVVNIGEVVNREGGSETVTASLSGELLRAVVELDGQEVASIQSGNRTSELQGLAARGTGGRGRVRAAMLRRLDRGQRKLVQLPFKAVEEAAPLLRAILADDRHEHGRARPSRSPGDRQHLAAPGPLRAVDLVRLP